LLVATVYFDSAEWTLRSRQHHRLAGVGARLVRGGFSRVEVRGYTDAYGTAEYNLWLSEKRTHTVARILLARTGLHSTQSWYGKRHPVASSATARGAARNRRACVFAR
jgi:outer membrane protein OmpA-like peptidoglycan-associated protein